MIRRGGMTLIGLAIASCAARVEPARAQWVLHVATDAPLADMGDRLLIEVLYKNGQPYPSSRREFGVGESSAWPLSVGIEPVPGDPPPTVRITFYRATTVGADGLVATDRRIEALAHLPSADGLVHVAVSLPMRCWGVLSSFDSDETCDPATGAKVSIPTLATVADTIDSDLAKPGSWPPSQSVPCAGQADPDMICVPGGAFLMGRFPANPIDARANVPEQLVQLSPFFLDKDELSVGEMRALVDAGKVPASSVCPFSAAPDEQDDFPISCITFDEAQAVCAAVGKRLPTEAEWEFAASNRSSETKYPWITADEPCDAAVTGNGPGISAPYSSACEKLHVEPGLRARGMDKDITALGIRDLGGSVSEWVDGSFLDYSDSQCWGLDPGLRVNPNCDKGTEQLIRGGSWSTDPAFTQSAYRRGQPKPGDSVGVRCAK